jgi:hypothetical protein
LQRPVHILKHLHALDTIDWRPVCIVLVCSSRTAEVMTASNVRKTNPSKTCLILTQLSCIENASFPASIIKKFFTCATFGVIPGASPVSFWLAYPVKVIRLTGLIKRDLWYHGSEEKPLVCP